MNTDSLNGSLPYHHKRFYDCFEFAGVPKGKSYCDSMMIYEIPAWDKGNLFNCYRSKGVTGFGKQYCEYIFRDVDKTDPEEDYENKILECYAQQGEGKGEQYCEL
jgi:hypothetical protein